MLPVLTFTEVWTDIAARALTDHARETVSTAYDLWSSGKSKTIGKALHRARRYVNGGIEFGVRNRRKESRALPMVVPERNNRQHKELRRMLADLNNDVLSMYAAGHTMADIAVQYGVSTMTVSRWIAASVEKLREQFA